MDGQGSQCGDVTPSQVALICCSCFNEFIDVIVLVLQAVYAVVPDIALYIVKRFVLLKH